MTERRFYHLTRMALDEALPALLEKTLAKELRAVVRVGSAERAEALAQLLWTARDGFLPHGAKKDGFASDQPIWITDSDENPNGATVLFLADGADFVDVSGFDLVCDVFDGADEVALQKARENWKSAKKDGIEVSYWQQEARGWVKK